MLEVGPQIGFPLHPLNVTGTLAMAQMPQMISIPLRIVYTRDGRIPGALASLRRSPGLGRRQARDH